MKKSATILMLLALIASISFAQTIKQGRLKVYQVKSDQMLTCNNPFRGLTDCFWVETDESEGKIILNFESISHPSSPKVAYLIINIPNVQDGSSNTGLIVTLNGKKIGSIPNGTADSFVYISLDASAIISENITLTLIGGGIDGLVLS